MTAKLTLDKLGRIVLPKRVRDKLQLDAGDQLDPRAPEIESSCGPRAAPLGSAKFRASGSTIAANRSRPRRFSRLSTRSGASAMNRTWENAIESVLRYLGADSGFPRGSRASRAKPQSLCQRREGTRLLCRPQPGGSLLDDDAAARPASLERRTGDAVCREHGRASCAHRRERLDYRAGQCGVARLASGNHLYV